MTGTYLDQIKKAEDRGDALPFFLDFEELHNLFHPTTETGGTEMTDEAPIQEPEGDPDIHHDEQGMPERSWIAMETDRQIKKAEDRGDALPFFSGMMAAFFGKD